MIEKKDKKLFWSLMFWALVPSVYQLIRMHIIVSADVDINILGQLEWYDLLNEIIIVTLTVPLYFLLKPEKNGNSAEKNGTAFMLAISVYMVFSIIVYAEAKKLAELMLAGHAVDYLRIETISMAVEFVSTFMIILYTLNNKDTSIYMLLLLKIVLLICADLLIIPVYNENGVAYSTLLVNSIISMISVVIAARSKLMKFGKKIEYTWLKQWGKLGLYAGIQIFLDNFIYAVMVCRMVNQVGETGNYWIANNFIYGWLLLPVFQLSEIIKKNRIKKLEFHNVWKYGFYIILCWMVTQPFWNLFLKFGMGIQPGNIILIVNKMMLFYIPFLFSNLIDAWFISCGKNHFILVNSIVVNILYYGMVYILFLKGFFHLNIQFIMNMFGGGMLVHCVVSFIQLGKMNHDNRLYETN